MCWSVQIHVCVAKNGSGKGLREEIAVDLSLEAKIAIFQSEKQEEIETFNSKAKTTKESCQAGMEWSL